MDLKNLGNKRFGEGNWTAAADLFTQALIEDPELVVCYVNRAACWIKMARWAEGLEDCQNALQKPLTPQLKLKAYWRQATCQKELGLPYTESVAAGLAIDPENADLQQLYASTAPTQVPIHVLDTLPQKYSQNSVSKPISPSGSLQISRPLSYAGIQTLMRQNTPEADQLAFSIEPEELVVAHQGIGIDPEEIDYFHKLISTFGGPHGQALLAALKKCDRYASAEFLADEKLAAAAEASVLS